MKRAAYTLFVLSEKGSALTEEGVNFFLDQLNLSRSTQVYFGEYYNDPRFLAGSLTQAKNPIVAIYLNDTIYAIRKKDDIQVFLNLLMKGDRSSYEIFKESLK